MNLPPDEQGRRDMWFVVAFRPIGQVDLEAHRNGTFGFHRFILNQGAEADMREFFDKMVHSSCPLVELSASGRGVVRRHDRLTGILAAAPSPTQPGPEVLEALGRELLASDLRVQSDPGPNSPLGPSNQEVSNMPCHFVAKLADGGGPPPLVELHRIVEMAAESDDHTAWFATRKPGAGWRRAAGDASSIALLFATDRDGSVDAVVGEVLDRRDDIPDDPAAQELYGDHEGFRAWWRLANPVPVHLASLRAVPGSSSNGRSAADAFKGQLAFAYWDFGLPFADVVAQLRSAEASPLVPATAAGCDVSGRPAATAVPPAPSRVVRPGERPRFDIHGVDFSGGKESAAGGNSKLWVASWDVERGTISLRRGSDGTPLRRADLPALVRGQPGWWVFDFPFGVARETAVALNIDENNWRGWLDWCTAGGDATERRDAARVSVERSGCPWSARRAVDREHATTWFPLFEQLYKQTIYGARDVLKGLDAAPDVSILPWRDPEGARAVVVEGFPGVTIRTQLKLKGIGYKGRRAHHRDERKRVLDRLAGVLPDPLPPAIARIAVDDHEGDALDALVLLLAGWVAQEHPAWQARRSALTSERRLVEGWFPA